MVGQGEREGVLRYEEKGRLGKTEREESKGRSKGREGKEGGGREWE